MEPGKFGISGTRKFWTFWGPENSGCMGPGKFGIDGTRKIWDLWEPNILDFLGPGKFWMYGTRKFGNDGTQKIWGPASKCAGPLASPGGTCVNSCIGRSPLWGHPSTPLRGSECRCRESNVRSHLERQELRHTLKQALIQVEAGFDPADQFLRSETLVS